MTTILKKFDDAYATMTVAAYEPLILKWVSGFTLCTLASSLALRSQKSKNIKLEGAFTTARALAVRTTHLPTTENLKEMQSDVNKPELDIKSETSAKSVVDPEKKSSPEEALRKIMLKGYSSAVAVGDSIYPSGVVSVSPDSSHESKPLEVKTLPKFLSGVVGSVDKDFNVVAAERQIFDTLVVAAKSALTKKGTLAENISQNLRLQGIFEYLPVLGIEEALSPIGIAHYFKQYYFNSEEGYGPIEEACTVAPKETLEVVYEKTRKQTHEEVTEVGSEIVSEKAEEIKNLDEISDKVSSMIQRDSAASMSANASGSIAVWSFGASATASMATSSQRSRESTSRRLKEVTRRASERITKTYSVKTRDIEEVAEMNLTRRIIKNEGETPVSYGLRRIFRKVRVKVQDLGPRVVWQLYLENPGSGLARSRFVHFREAEPISVPEIPPGVPPRPQGGTDTGTTSSDLAWSDKYRTWYVTVVAQASADREITAISIDSITDLEGGGKGDTAPSPRNDVQWDAQWDGSTRTYRVNIGILPGDAASVSIGFTYSWEPSKTVKDDWEKLRKEAVAKLTQELLQEQFERDKTLITERSKIRPRPANDLRQEERYEVMNRLISYIFCRGDDPSSPTPLEIEYFHRYFDIGGMFVYTHPSWWKPRYTPVATAFQRPAYEITAESEPAPLGSSLGWLIQLDGDSRRNEFINSPWVRICMPMRPGREREAVQWLARHIEGEIGYDIGKSPLKDLLDEIEKRRSLEDSLGINGPEYVTVNSTVGAPSDPQKPESVYPIIEEFYATIPTDGFIFDEIKI